MNLLVIGAAGRTGRHVVEQALGHGHTVTAFTHDSPFDLAELDVRLLKGDARDFEAVNAAMVGQTGVIVAVGSGGGPQIHESVVANVVHAMAVNGSTRLAVLSAAGAFARKDPHLSLAFKALIATTMRANYDDLEAAEMRVMASDLDWVIVRPVGLSDGAATGHYRMNREGLIPSKPQRISRADVAAVLLKGVELEAYRREVLVVAQ